MLDYIDHVVDVSAVPCDELLLLLENLFNEALVLPTESIGVSSVLPLQVIDSGYCIIERHGFVVVSRSDGGTALLGLNLSSLWSLLLLRCHVRPEVLGHKQVAGCCPLLLVLLLLVDHVGRLLETARLLDDGVGALYLSLLLLLLELVSRCSGGLLQLGGRWGGLLGHLLLQMVVHVGLHLLAHPIVDLILLLECSMHLLLNRLLRSELLLLLLESRLLLLHGSWGF